MLRNLEGHELPLINFVHARWENESEDLTCTLAVDSIEESSRNEEIIVRRIQATRTSSFDVYAAKKKEKKPFQRPLGENKIRICLESRRAQVQGHRILCEDRSEHPQDGSGYYFWPSHVSLRYDNSMHLCIEHRDQACQGHHTGLVWLEQQLGFMTLYVFQWLQPMSALRENNNKWSGRENVGRAMVFRSP